MDCIPRHEECAFKSGSGIAQLDACYAAEYAPALPAARLVGKVELSSNPRSMFAMLTEGICTLPSKSNCRVSSSPEPLSLTTLRALHGAVSLRKLNPKSAHPSCHWPRPRVTISHMFIQSCPWSGRVPSSTSTINQNPPALFHFPDSAQATIAYPLLGS